MSGMAKTVPKRNRILSGDHCVMDPRSIVSVYSAEDEESLLDLLAELPSIGGWRGRKDLRCSFSRREEMVAQILAA